MKQLRRDAVEDFLRLLFRKNVLLNLSGLQSSLKLDTQPYRRKTLNSILSVDNSLTSIVLNNTRASSIMASSKVISSL